MSSNSKNPMFYILESKPKRYINTPSATIVMIIRAIEGVVALALMSRVLGYLTGLFGGTSPSVFQLPGILQTGGQAGALQGLLPFGMEGLLEQALGDLMPEGATLESLLDESLRQMFGDSQVAMDTLFTMSLSETIVTAVATLALLAILVATVVEAVAFIFLRFALKGSRAAKIAHKVIYIAALVLLIAGVCLAALFANKCRMLGFMSVLLAGQLRTMVILFWVCMVILLIRVLYHKDVARTLAAVHYEIDLEFKETDLEAKRLGGCALIFIVLALAGAVLMGFRSGPLSVGVIAMVVLMIKYIMVYTCWGNFQRCHM